MYRFFSQITYASNVCRCFKVKFEMLASTIFLGVGIALRTKVSNNKYKSSITFNILHSHCLSFMHAVHHFEPPPVHLTIDEVLLDVEYSTPSTKDNDKRY